MGTEFSAPFAGTPIATAAQYRAKYASNQPDVINEAITSNALQVSNNGNTQVTVQMGSAVIQGALYQLTGSVHNLAVAAAGGSTRKDIVVLRYDPSTPGIYLYIVQGTPGAGLPALTNSPTGIWDFPLAQYDKEVSGNVTNILDLRKFSDGCGGVIGFNGGEYPPAPKAGSIYRIYPQLTTWIYDATEGWLLHNSGHDRFTFAPTYRWGGGSASLGAGVAYGRYSITNRSEVYYTQSFELGAGATVNTGALYSDPPVPARDTPAPGGGINFHSFWLVDSSASTWYFGNTLLYNSTTLIHMYTHTSTSGLTSVTNSAPVALAVGDYWVSSGNYEADL